MKEFFKETRFKQPSLDTIELCNGIIADYQAERLTLTLRQIYYQLVGRALIPNDERSYKNLGSVISKARLAGLMDWDAIEDRGRQPWEWPEFGSLQLAVDEAVEYFRLPRMVGQETYVELWVEKDALAGVLQPIASRYHVTMMVNRGYSSQSAMYASARRIDRCTVGNGSNGAIILYLGDFDPSGEDMVRDISERLNMFCEEQISVVKLALTMDQVDTYQPPPNPTKLTDSRARKFVMEHGYESWEVDALPPRTLRQIIEVAIEECIDMDMYRAVLSRESAARTAWERKMEEKMSYRRGDLK